MLQIRNFKSWNFMAKKSLHLINYTAFVIQLTINQMLSDCNGTRSHNHLVRKRSTAWKVSKYGVFSGPYFPVFGLNKERYSVSLRIQSECGKIRTRRNSVFRHFLRSERPDIQGEWFKASTKVMKRLCMMLVLAPMDHILN